MPAVTSWTPPGQVRRGPGKPGVHTHNLRRRAASGQQRYPVLRTLQVLFLLVGLAGIVYYTYSLIDQYVYQAYANWAFDQEIAGHRVTFTDYLRSETPLRYLVPASAVAKAPAVTSAPGIAGSPRPSNGDLLGRIEIQRLHLSAIVREGVDDDTLRRAVGHIPSTALPGESGNFAIAAHRDTLFRALKDIHKDDRVTFQSENQTFTYQVVSTRIVNPTDVSVLNPEPPEPRTGESNAGAPEKTLTMITCYPFYFVGSAPQRFIVKARLVDDQPENGAAPSPPRSLPAGQRGAKPSPGKPMARAGPHSQSLASAHHRPRQSRGFSQLAQNDQPADAVDPPARNRRHHGFWHKLAKVFGRQSD